MESSCVQRNDSIPSFWASFHWRPGVLWTWPTSPGPLQSCPFVIPNSLLQLPLSKNRGHLLRQKPPNAKHVSLGRVETHHSDIAKLNWWVSLDCKAGGTFWSLWASARVAIIYTWCIIYPNHGSKKKLLSFKDCPLKPDHPPIQILQSSGQERECQQKLWNFSSQNLVNVAWSFAKANLGILETLGVPTLW